MPHTDYFDLFGVSLAISADDPEIRSAIRSRLRRFTASQPSPDELTIEYCSVGDGAHHAVQRPRGAMRPVYEPPVGEVLYSDAEDCLYIDYADRVRVLCRPGLGHAQASVLMPAVSADALWLASHPLLTLMLIEFLKRRGRFNLHAAGVCVDGQGLLFPGASGSGKSTLALALLRGGLDLLGDDLVFLARNQAGLHLYGFSEDIDVTSRTANFFPELHSLVNQPRTYGHPKWQVQPDEMYRVQSVRECQPAALIFPRIAHSDESTLKPMDRDEALLELAPNVLLTEARSAQAHLDLLAELVRTCACYRLETGRDFDTLPQLVRGLVQ